jgi:hypothetical protein
MCVCVRINVLRKGEEIDISFSRRTLLEKLLGTKVWDLLRGITEKQHYCRGVSHE